MKNFPFQRIINFVFIPIMVLSVILAVVLHLQDASFNDQLQGYIKTVNQENEDLRIENEKLKVKLQEAEAGGDDEVSTNSSDIEDDTIKFDVVNTGEYIRDGKKCLNFRVMVDKNYSDKKIIAIYYGLTQDDYYLHTVWFYDLESDRENLGVYNVAKMEETEKGVIPEVEPPLF